jgi:hypothetical protein
MPTKKLTDLFVERVKPPERGRTEYFDASFPGLALRVTDQGRKSWSLLYRIHGRLRRFTLGQYPAIKPAQARREAMEALERVRQGVDPSAEKQVQRLARPLEAETFGAVAREYLDRHARLNLAPVTYKETKRILERDGIPAWGARPIASIARRDVITVIRRDRGSRRGCPSQPYAGAAACAISLGHRKGFSSGVPDSRHAGAGEGAGTRSHAQR